MAYKDYAGASANLGIIDLGGGLNSTASPLSLESNQSSDLLNVEFDVYGAMRKRDGYTALNETEANSGAPGVGVFNFNLNKSNSTTLVGIFGDGLFKMDDLDGTWDSIVITGATLTSGALNLASFTQLDDTLLITNGVDVPLQWAGTGAAAPAAVPTGLTDSKYVCTWNNYAFYANVQVSATWYRSRFYWSDLSDVSSWQSYNWIEVSNDDGDEITGIYAFGEKLVIFKNNSIHNVFFTGDRDVPFIARKSYSSVGCISHYSIKEVNNTLIFLSYDGIYQYDGNNAGKISDKINTTFASLETSLFQYSTAIYFHSKDTYLISMATSGNSTKNRVITYNTIKQSFSVWSGVSSNYMTNLKYQGEERIYSQDYSGFCYRLYSGIDDYPLNVRTAINGYWKSKWFDFGNIVDKKGVLHIVLYHEITNNSIILSYSYDLENADSYTQSVDLSTSADVYGSSFYGTARYASSGGKLERIDLKGRGRLFRVSFSNAVLGEGFKIYAIGFYPHLETVA